MANSIVTYVIDCSLDKSVYIGNVANSLNCNCKCGKCGEIVEAIKRKINEWNFRHSKESICAGGQETAIHKAAKQIIVDNTKISIPGENIHYSQAVPEVNIGSIIPDVAVVSNGEKIYFEIAVANPVDFFKEDFYNKWHYKSIEINLTNISYDITPEESKELVLKSAPRRKLFWTSDIQKFSKTKGLLELIMPVIVLTIAGYILYHLIRQKRKKIRKGFVIKQAYRKDRFIPNYL